MAELRQPSTPQSVSPPCCRVCLLFQGGEAVLSPQDPFPGAELAGIKCSDLRGFSVTHHLIIPQLLPAAVCSGEFTAIALPIPSLIPVFAAAIPVPNGPHRHREAAARQHEEGQMGHRGKGELFPAQPSGKTEPKGLSTWRGTSRPAPALPAAVPVLLSPLAPGSGALWPLSLRGTGPGVAPRAHPGKEQQDVTLLAPSRPSWRDR